MASKAQHIRLLYDAGATVAAIASMLGVSTEYVRVCARQRRNGAGMATNKDKRKAYSYGDREAARKAQIDAYHRLRSDGHSSDYAGSRSGGAYSATMVATGRKRRFAELTSVDTSVEQ